MVLEMTVELCILGVFTVYDGAFYYLAYGAKLGNN